MRKSYYLIDKDTLLYVLKDISRVYYRIAGYPSQLVNMKRVFTTKYNGKFCVDIFGKTAYVFEV